MSEHNVASAPIHGTLENSTGGTGVDLPVTPHTTQIGRPHTNSIESNKSGRGVSSSTPIGSTSGMISQLLGTNKPNFVKVIQINYVTIGLLNLERYKVKLSTIHDFLTLPNA